MTVAGLIDALGGTSIVARALGEPVTTVHAWKVKGRLPRWRRPALLELAREKGVDASDEDLDSQPAEAA